MRDNDIETHRFVLKPTTDKVSIQKEDDFTYIRLGKQPTSQLYEEYNSINTSSKRTSRPINNPTSAWSENPDYLEVTNKNEFSTNTKKNSKNQYKKDRNAPPQKRPVNPQ